MLTNLIRNDLLKYFYFPLPFSASTTLHLFDNLKLQVTFRIKIIQCCWAITCDQAIQKGTNIT